MHLKISSVKQFPNNGRYSDICGDLTVCLNSARKWLQWRRVSISIHLPLNSLFRMIPKVTSQIRISDPLWGNPPVTGGFPSPRHSNAESVFHVVTSSCVHKLNSEQFIYSQPVWFAHSRLLPICNAFCIQRGHRRSLPILRKKFFLIREQSDGGHRIKRALYIGIKRLNRGGERRWPQNKTGVVHRYQATVLTAHCALCFLT